ncbi:hypothetical protein [Halorussus sp. AFM4]|uniref:hypothetical protein n=1 Tax=Halorussus sp. AFM4 TaxID=3421651 RepID=UPI003EB8D606
MGDSKATRRATAPSGERAGDAPTPRDDPRETGVSRWLLIDGNRWAVSAGLLAVILAAFVALDVAGLLPITLSDPYLYLFSGLLTGNLTLVTVVLSINQLVLSRELGSVSDLEERLEDAIDYRRRVEKDVGEATAPVLPGDFLAFVYRNARTQAEELRGRVSGADDARPASDVAAFTDRFLDRIGAIERTLDRDDVDLIDALSASIAVDYSTQTHELSRLRERHEASLSEETKDTMDGLVQRLRQIEIAQQYFKTVYVQEELAYLSKALLYVGIPAEVISTMALLSIAVEMDVPARRLLTTGQLHVLLPVLTTVLFTPVVVLFTYVVRVATISRRTTPTSPFTVSTARSGEPGE